MVGSRARRIGALHNPIDSGRLLNNRVQMVQHFESQKRLSRINPASEWEYADHPELRIIDEESWLAVQAWRAANVDVPDWSMCKPAARDARSTS